MRREFEPNYSPLDEGGHSGAGKEKLQPTQLNARLRNLYGELQKKLSTDPDQEIRDIAAESAREEIESIQGQLDIDQSMEMQNYLFISTAQFESTREILDLIKAGIIISEGTPYYKQYLLEHIEKETIYPPEHFREYPINIDNPRYMWGVGKTGEAGIFARDTALHLEVAAYRSEKMNLDLTHQIEPITVNSKSGRKRKAFLSKWKAAIVEHYGLTPELDSSDYNFSSFYN